MTIGYRARLELTVATLELFTLPGGHLKIEDGVYMNYGSSFASSAHVRVNNDWLIGTHEMVMGRDSHRVEDKIWLGNRSIVANGVTIGHDVVVAAGSIVSPEVPLRSVVAGVPARVVRRF
jgi:maltose O-acetyltransferase